MKLKHRYTKHVFTDENFVTYEVICTNRKHFTVFSDDRLIGSIEFVGGTGSKTKALLALRRILEQKS